MGVQTALWAIATAFTTPSPVTTYHLWHLFDVTFDIFINNHDNDNEKKLLTLSAIVLGAVVTPAIATAQSIRTETFQSVCGVETEQNSYYQYHCEVINNYNGAVLARTILRSSDMQVILVWLPQNHVEVQFEGMESQQSIYHRSEGMTSFNDGDGTYRYYFSDRGAAQFELQNFQERR